MSKNYRVRKRDNSIEPLDISKIRNVINWAIQGTNLSGLKLEVNMNMVYKDLMTTEYIQMSLINTALKLVSIEEPEWNLVAGRLYMMNHYKNVSLQRNKVLGYSPDLFYNHIVSNVNSGLYHKILLDVYSKDDIYELANYIKPERDFIYDYAGANYLVNRYLLQSNGNQIIELPQEMFMIISMMIEAFNSHYNNEIGEDEKYFGLLEDNRIYHVKKIYDLLSTRKISLATPILINLRKPKSNLSSCFILSVDDDLKSIMYGLNTAAFISQEGGGVGVNVSRCRSKNSWIRGIFNRGGGVIPWVKLFNDVAISVNQLGKREGAITVSLDIWHYDILDFLDIQTENGDQRMKCYDIFPQIIITDCFMKKVKNDQFWYMFDPYEIKVKFGYDLPSLWGDKFEEVYEELVESIERFGISENLDSETFYNNYIQKLSENNELDYSLNSKNILLFRRIKAKELMKLIMKVQIETGLPYLTFKDTINKYNPNKYTGYIPGGNLCQESFSNVSPLMVMQDNDNGVIKTTGLVHTCNLLSIVLANLTKEEIPEICYYSVRILDNLIDITENPVFESKRHNVFYRTLGIGMMGLADYLAKNCIKYSDSVDFVDDLAEYISANTFLASVILSKVRGTFFMYVTSELAKGIILGKNKEEMLKIAKYKDIWVKVYDLGKQYGFRNSQLLAIAPNTSTSKVMGCTASVLPVYGKMFIDDSKGMIPILPPYIKSHLWYYQENKNLDQKYVVDVVSTIQKWVDTGISMELLFNLNNESVTAKYIYDLYFYAWEKGIKTIYYIRTIQKSGISFKKEECVSCSG